VVLILNTDSPSKYLAELATHQLQVGNQMILQGLVLLRSTDKVFEYNLKIISNGLLRSGRHIRLSSSTVNREINWVSS
jgi:hypothetical protein